MKSVNRSESKTVMPSLVLVLLRVQELPLLTVLVLEELRQKENPDTLLIKCILLLRM